MPIQARLNLVKIFLIIPIIIFHSFVGLIGIENLTTEPKFNTWNNIIDFFGNSFFASFGFFVACLSFFTYGFHSDQFKHKKMGTYVFKAFVLLLCLLGSQFDFSKSVADPEFFTWDLYSFIFVVFAGIYLIKPWVKQNAQRCFFVFLALFIVSPFLGNLFYPLLHLNILQVLLPVKVVSDANSWFLLPWIFAPLMFYAAGAHLKLSNLSKLNLAVLLGVSALAVAYFIIKRPLYYSFSLEIDAAYMNFFWQHISINIIKVFLFCFFLLVLCSKHFVFLETNFILRKLRYLQWCRHFWLCYILHLGFKDIIADMGPKFLESEFVLSYIWLIIFLATEILAQMFFGWLAIYKFIFKTLIAKLRIRNA